MTEAPKSAPSVRLTLSVIILVAVAVRIYLMVSTRSTAEDFYITLRYAENLAHGNGLVYNVGELVLGTTTPLYTLFLGLAAFLGLDATFFGKLANITADGLACYLIWRLASAAGRPGAGLIGSALFALSPPNLTWAISGMETSLVTACTLALFVAASERRLPWVAVFGGLLYMLRVDGLLAVAIAFGALLWSARRKGDTRAVWRSVALFAVVCAPWTLFAWIYFGSPLPTSALAKLTVYAWMSKGALPNVGPFVDQMTHTKVHLLVAIGALTGALYSLIRAPMLRPALIWMLAYYTAMAISKGFLFGWYYIPPSGIYFLCSVLGWWWVAAELSNRLRGIPSPALPLDNAQAERTSFAAAGPALFIALVLLGVGLVRLPAVKADLITAQGVEERLRKPIGLALKKLVQPGERVMLEPIGYIGYFSGARILDSVGLVSPEAIPYYRKGAVSPYLDMMRDLKPEWVLLRAGELADMAKGNVQAGLTTQYRLERTFSDTEAPPDSTPAFFLFRRL
jgi:hypothetical protein